jgi:hypothetical protein
MIGTKTILNKMRCSTDLAHGSSEVIATSIDRSRRRVGGPDPEMAKFLRVGQRDVINPGLGHRNWLCRLESTRTHWSNAIMQFKYIPFFHIDNFSLRSDSLQWIDTAALRRRCVLRLMD